MAKRIALQAVLLVLAGSLAGALESTIRYADLDDDGQAEIILANQYLKVELMSGVPPVETPLSWYQRVGRWFRKPEVVPPKYGKRFVWAGWIHNIEFLPTNRRWFTNKIQGKETWDGIPEEFGETVKMAKLEDGSFACLKMGIGEAIGKGLCLRGSLKLTKPAPWQFDTKTTEDGTAVVTFTQQVDTEYGYGYIYKKEFRLPADSSVLQVTRTLTNTGANPIHTTWYSHGFWGQAGNGYDAGCWSTIPLQNLAGDKADVNTMPCRVGDPTPTTYWGPISAEEIAEPWYASGYTPSREVFVNRFSERLAWSRVWTHAQTYSCEPFVLIDLGPGETKTWTIARAAVHGLDGAAAEGPGAVVDLGGPDQHWLDISLATYQPLAGVQVRLRYRPDGSDKDLIDQTVTLAKCGPNWPGRVRLERHRLAGTPSVFQITATHSGRVLLDTTRRISPHTAGLPPAWLGAAKGKRAVVLAKTHRVDDVVKPTPATFYWAFALQRAGFDVTVLPIGEATEEGALAGTQVVVVSGPVRVPDKLVGQLTDFVDGGGGLVMTGPLDLRPFELSDLLPISAVTADVVAQGLAPRDGTREFLDASKFRYQLQLNASHPAVADLPLYPATLQSIGRMQVVEPRDNAQTILTYTGPEGLQPRVASPALVVGTHGQGRVAVFASPINWGTPQQWCIWSRLGEYHQQFFGQLAQWAAGQTVEADKE
jgi:uncharacterized membrane protein